MFLDREQVDSMILKLGLVSQEDFDIAEKEAQVLSLQSSKKGFNLK